MIKNKKGSILPIFVLLLFLSIFLILFFNSYGTVKMNIKDIILILLGKHENKIYSNLIWNIRFPRVLGSFLVGAILGLSGNILQLIIQNPLADPYILGISSGASFGAVFYSALTMIFALKIPFGMEFFAFVFSLISTFLVFLIAKEGKKLPLLSLILSGVIVSFLFNSITTLFTVMYWRNLIHINIWLLGSTADITWRDITLFFVILLIQLITIFYFSKELNVLSMGEKLAIYSGVNPERVKLILLIVNVLAISITVSKVGIIGFVGLIIPHVVRMIFGPKSQISSFFIVFIGGIFLSMADLISRTILAPTELPIGVITSLIGAPIFIIVLKKRRSIND